MKIPNFSKRQLRDAARLATQSAAAASGMFLLMRWFEMPEQFVGILSAVLVVQPTAGRTLGAAQDRVVATLVGSAIGMVCLFVLPAGYGTAIALALSMLVMNGIAGLKSEWRYGTVAAMALALGSDNDLWQTAQDRSIAIGAGALFGAAVSILVWPDSSRKRANRHLTSCLRACARRLDAAVESATHASHDDADEARNLYHSNLESARLAAEGMRFGDNGPLLDQINQTERLYNSILIVNRVAEETDEVAEGNDRLAEAVEQIRELGCAVANHFADGERDQTPSIDEVWEAVSRAREAVAEDNTGQGPRTHVLRNAMVFALGEVADGLTDLQEAFKEEKT